MLLLIIHWVSLKMLISNFYNTGFWIYSTINYIYLSANFCLFNFDNLWLYNPIECYRRRCDWWDGKHQFECSRNSIRFTTIAIVWCPELYWCAMSTEKGNWKIWRNWVYSRSTNCKSSHENKMSFIIL